MIFYEPQACEPAAQRTESDTLEINLRLCDLVNGDFLAHGKDVVKALRNRLTPGRRSGETETNARALFALEMCMKNCGGRFHAMVAAKDVPQVMVRLCEKAPTLEVRDKCLTLVEEWAANLRREPAFAEAFHALRRAGYRFPNPQQGRDGLSGAAREVPAPVAAESFNGRGDWSARTDISEADRNAIAAALAEEEEEIRAAAAAEEQARRVESARVAAANEGRRGIYPSHIATGIPVNAPPHLAGESDFERALRESERTAAEDVARRQQVSSSSSTTTPHAVAHTPQGVAKLKADVGVAKNSLQIFSKTLDETDLSQPATKNGLQGGIASDLAGQCRAMQPRLIELISNAHDEELLASAIELNEALTKEVARFDLMTRACSGDADAFARLRGGTQSTKPTIKATTTESLLSQLDEGLRVASSPPASTSNPFDHPAPPLTNPFQRPPEPSPSPSQSIPTMATVRVNPIFDGIYAPDASPPHAHRSLPVGSSAMNGVASASPAASPASSAGARSHHRPSPISDPFADLSAAAAVRVTRSPQPRSGGPGAHRSELPDV